MRPILFNENDTNYSHNGIGVLHEALRCDVYEEYNGTFDVELEYPVDGELANEIVERRQILAKPNDIDEPHAFRIYEIEKDLESGVIFARGLSITNDLAGNLITNVSVTNSTPQQALTAIKNNLIEPTIFDFVSDIQISADAKWTRINPLQAIVGDKDSMIQTWGGDVKRTNNAVYLYSRRGRDKVTIIRPGKNMDGFNMIVSDKSSVTKILPHYTYKPETLPEYEMVTSYDGTLVKAPKYTEPVINAQPPERVTVEGTVVVSANDGQYVVSRYTPVDYSSNKTIQDKIRSYIDARIAEVESSTTAMDVSGFPEELRLYVIDQLNLEASSYFTNVNPGSDKPSVQIKVNMIQISDSPDWERYKDLERIQVTDTVDVYVKKFNTDVTVTIQSIKYDSIGERVISITAGNARSSLSKDISKGYEQQTKKIEEYLDTVENGVYNTINRTSDGRNRRFEGYTEPAASISSEGDLWFKESGVGVVDVYIYQGGVWQPKVSGAEVMERLVALGIDAKEVTIVNLDAKSIVGGDLTVTETFRIMHNNSPVLEVDAATGQVKITAPNLATQTDLAAKKSMNSLTEYYLATSSSTGVTTSTTGWTTTMQTTTTTNKYLWNYSIITYDDATTHTIDPIIIGVHGEVGPQGATGPQGLQGIQGPQGDQGIQGPVGADGLSSYTHIAYATGTNGENFSTIHFSSATYIGMYVDNIATDSTNHLDYAWSLIKGADGAQGIQGPAGADGLTPYFHTAWANSADGVTGFSTTDSVNKLYIGTYTDYTATDSTDPAKYSWTLIKGDKGDTGATGPQGIQGPAGADGQSLFTWIKYADDNIGTGMSDLPDGKSYIGIAYNKTSSTESSTATEYSWSKIEGDQGIQGPTGTDGITYYTWIKYADTDTGSGMSDSPTGKRYLGLAYNKTTATESSTASDYSWSPLYDNVQVGGRNLLPYITIGEYGGGANAPFTATKVVVEDSKISVITQLTDLVGFTISDVSNLQGQNLTLSLYTDLISPITYYKFNDDTQKNKSLIQNGNRWECSITVPANSVSLDIGVGRYPHPATFVEYYVDKVQLEKGNIATDWTPAPEDVQADINKKAETTDMDNLAGIVSDIQTQVNNRTTTGEFQLLKDDYDARMAQDILDKEKLTNDLSTIEGRTTLIETLAGNNKIVTDFVNTVITESAEGIYISNKNSATGILISDSRISFMDNNVEVAYISNQTMQINHGIFVESATIANFKFEIIPGTTIMAIQWVGG